jgi:HSP20 family molecular chaperone IbpA
MTLVQWQTLRSLEQLHQELRQAIDDLLDLATSSTPWVSKGDYRYISQIQVCNNSTNVTLEIKIIGIAPEQLEVRITPTHLILKGEITERVYIEGYCDFTYTPAPFQDFVPLPYPVHPETAITEFLEDWLIVSLPKPMVDQSLSVKVDSRPKAESVNLFKRGSLNV